MVFAICGEESHDDLEYVLYSTQADSSGLTTRPGAHDTGKMVR